MSGRSIFTIVAVLVVAALVGIGAYDAGLAQGAAQVAQPGAAPVGYYGPHFWGFGFPFFGLLFPILFFFLIFALIRGAFWGGRWGGGPGYWRGPDATSERQRMLDEWHRRAHDERPSAERPSPPPRQ